MNGLITLITGGAAGLGLACAKRFARQGARVIICDLPKSKGHDIVEKWSSGYVSSSNSDLNEPDNSTDEKTSNNEENNIQLEKPSFFPADITNEEQIKQTMQQIKDKYGKLDVVLNCVGIGSALRTYNMNKGSLHDLGKFQRILDVNVSGTFNVIRWACHIMADNPVNSQGQRGVIVNTASIAAYEGQIGQVAYAASKGAITSMTLPLARDLSNMGIRVCAIAPGVFHTPMVADMPAKVQALLGRMVPFPSRLGRSDDFASLAQTIVENPYLNGEVIRLDGALRLPP